jgi:hypothetical protein
LARLKHAGFGIALCCALSLGVAGCGGGGGSAPDAGEPGAAPSAAAPPVAQAAAVVALRPNLYIERDPNGTTYLRVEEQAFNPFATVAAQRVIQNRVLGPSPGTSFGISGAQTTRVSNVDVVRMEHGLNLQASATVSIYDYTYVDFDGGAGIYGAAIKIGATRPTNGPTYIQRVFADGKEAPDGSYTRSNTDFIGIEYDSGPIFIRNVTGRNFGDAGIDSKSGPVYVMNATLQGGHRMVRAWSNTEIILLNSIVNTSPGHAQVWLEDATATVRYRNVLWCLNAAAPSATSPDCRFTPWLIQGERINAAQATARVVHMSSNPLQAVSPFFRTQIDSVVIEYSRVGGGTPWRALTIANTGGTGSAPIGDMRYRIPLTLTADNYRFRVRLISKGVQIGQTSLSINEAGVVVN